METTEQPKKKFNPAKVIIPIILAVAAFFGIKSWLHSRHYESTDNASIEATNVPILARVSGYVDSLVVSDYDEVKAGQLLLTIDPREYQLSLQQAQADQSQAAADLENARAGLLNADRNLVLAKANLDVQKARLDKAQEDLKRDQALFNDGSITLKQFEDTKSNQLIAQRQFNSNQSQVSAASAQVSTAQAQIQKAQAQIETRKALVDQAKLKLTFTTLTAPASGKVGKKNIDKGQYVQPGQTLFTIVNKDKFWVIANFKETQLQKMKEGQEVDLYLDGYPEQTLKGKVTSMSEATGAKFALLPPDNSTGNFVKITQRVPVKIEISDVDKYRDILRAGLSLTAEVKID